MRQPLSLHVQPVFFVDGQSGLLYLLDLEP